MVYGKSSRNFFDIGKDRGCRQFAHHSQEHRLAIEVMAFSQVSTGNEIECPDKGRRASVCGMIIGRDRRPERVEKDGGMKVIVYFEDNVPCSDDFFVSNSKTFEFRHAFLSCMQACDEIRILGIEDVGTVLDLPELSTRQSINGFPLRGETNSMNRAEKRVKQDSEISLLCNRSQNRFAFVEAFGDVDVFGLCAQLEEGKIGCRAFVIEKIAL